MTKRSAASSSSIASVEQTPAAGGRLRAPRLLRELESDLKSSSKGETRLRQKRRRVGLRSQKPLAKKRRRKAPVEKPLTERNATPLHEDTPSSPPELERAPKYENRGKTTMADTSTQSPTDADAETPTEMQNSGSERNAVVVAEKAREASSCKPPVMDEMPSRSTRNDSNKKEESFKPITHLPTENEPATSAEQSIRSITPDPTAPSPSSSLAQTLTNPLESMTTTATPTKLGLHEISTADMAKFLEDVLWSSPSSPSDSDIHSNTPSWPPIALVQPFCETITGDLPRGTAPEICGWMVEDDDEGEGDTSLAIA